VQSACSVARIDSKCVYGCAYRLVSARCGQPRFVAVAIRAACDRFRFLAARRSLFNRTFNPKVVSSSLTRPTRFAGVLSCDCTSTRTCVRTRRRATCARLRSISLSNSRSIAGRCSSLQFVPWDFRSSDWKRPVPVSFHAGIDRRQPRDNGHGIDRSRRHGLLSLRETPGSEGARFRKPLLYPLSYGGDARTVAPLRSAERRSRRSRAGSLTSVLNVADRPELRPRVTCRSRPG
jgi:hypothetical protein